VVQKVGQVKMMQSLNRLQYDAISLVFFEVAFHKKLKNTIMGN
jgi:hypothetical protein